MQGIAILIVTSVGMFGLLTAIPLITRMYNLNHIKSKTVGDGQHGTARWATRKEIRQTYQHIPFSPEAWRKQAAAGNEPTICETNKPLPQGIVVGCAGGKHNTTATLSVPEGRFCVFSDFTV